MAATAAALAATDGGALDNVATAEAAGLRYVSDDRPGITRRRAGRGFSYRAPDGTAIREAERLRELRALAIPPAWRDVWICPNPNGHLLATGRDARGRKQYRYHPRWREVRDATKFDRMVPFGAALPTIRQRIDRDIALRGLPREKVLAAVLRLIDAALLRVGNDEYARLNDSFGAATMFRCCDTTGRLYRLSSYRTIRSDPSATAHRCRPVDTEADPPASVPPPRTPSQPRPACRFPAVC